MSMGSMRIRRCRTYPRIHSIFLIMTNFKAIIISSIKTPTVASLVNGDGKVQKGANNEILARMKSMTKK